MPALRVNENPCPASISGGFCAQVAHDGIQGPVNQGTLFEQSQAASAHLVSQLDTGLLDDFQAHPVDEHKAVRFINNG